MNIQRRYLIFHVSGFLSYTQKRCDLRGGGGRERERQRDRDRERQRQTDRKTMGKSDRDGGRERDIEKE